MSEQDRFVRLPELVKLTGLSRVTLWRLEGRGDFPARVRLSSNTVAWRLSAVLGWMESRQAA